MPYCLAVTGAPASGKTTLSRRLGEMFGARVLDLNSVVCENGLSEGYDALRQTEVVDVRRLALKVRDMRRGDTILDGLLSHLLEPTHVLVLRCSPTTLAERMVSRGYSREKILENLEAEYAGVILGESLKLCRNVYEADNTVGIDAGAVREWVGAGGVSVSWKDWTGEFVDVLASMGSSPTSGPTYRRP